MKNLQKLLFGSVILALVGIAVTFTSCEKTDLISNQTVENLRSEIATDPTAHLMLSAYENPSEVTIETVAKEGKIVIADLWSKKSKCKKIGVCKWFPKDVKKESLIGEAYKELLSGRSIIINVESILSAKKISLYFQNSTEGVSSRDLEFVISDDIYIGTSNKIKAGVYFINTKMGEFGGYEIPIHKTAL